MEISYDASALLDNMPYNLEAEQSVLGSVLLEPSTVTGVMKYIKPECFYREQHRDIFAVILHMFTNGAAIDFVTVLNEVIKEGIFDSPEAAKLYMAQLMEIVPTAANIENYCKIVQEKYYIRMLITAARDILNKAADGQGDAKQLLDMAEQRIFEIRQGRDTSGLVPIKEVVLKTYDHLQKLTGENRDKYKGLPTGFKILDTVITGLNKSDLIIVAARPGMGKTAFALNIAVNVAKNNDLQVALFSLEMSKEQLVSRVLSSEALISGNQMKTGDISGDDWVKLAASAEVVSRTQIYIDDTPNQTVAEMKAKLRRMKNIGLVVIDYLQLMSTGRRDGNRVQEISEITRNLKIMAKELDVPVIVLSQLARSAESRPDHKPMLSDLRESGSIEQDADIVMFLFREGYYDKTSENQNIAQCIVAKNRHGETSSIELGWEGEYTLFRNIDKYRNEE